MQQVAHFPDADARIRASTAYRNAEKDLDFWAVVLLGTRGRVPRNWSDNYGVWPVRVGLTQQPEDYAARVDLDAGAIHEYVALEWTWAASKRHATRVKTKLDHLLLGVDERNRLRNAWRTVEDPAIEWPILLAQAIQEIEAGGETVELFDGAEKHQIILAHMFGRRRPRM